MSEYKIELPVYADVSVFEKKFFDRMVEKRMEETGTGSPEHYRELLITDQAEKQNLSRLLFVSYSEFFRNQLTFAVLSRLIMPEIIHATISNPNREIRIWSAAASAGQEAYSVAMLIEEQACASNTRVNYRIFASDVNDSVLAAGEQGVFDQPAMANIPFKFVEKWFSRDNSHFTIKPELRQKITFLNFDLLNASMYCPPECIYGDFDIVLCSNILFYYQPEIRREILNKVIRCLKPNGYLVTGEAERDSITSRLLREVYPLSAIFILKNSAELPRRPLII